MQHSQVEALTSPVMATQIAPPAPRRWDVDRDPFAWKQFLPRFDSPSPHEKFRRMRWHRCLIPVVLVLVVVALMRLFAATDPVFEPYVFVEMRAVDMTGRPVAGAAVYVNKQAMGLTDVFGEWRRLLRLRPDTELPVLIVKQTSTGKWVGSRGLRVPTKTTEHGELEMHASIRVQPAQRVGQ